MQSFEISRAAKKFLHVFAHAPERRWAVGHLAKGCAFIITSILTSLPPSASTTLEAAWGLEDQP